jgi:hypothetical protein
MLSWGSRITDRSKRLLLKHRFALTSIGLLGTFLAFASHEFTATEPVAIVVPPTEAENAVLMLRGRAHIFVSDWEFVNLEGDNPSIRYVVSNTGDSATVLKRERTGFQLSALPKQWVSLNEQVLNGTPLLRGFPLVQTHSIYPDITKLLAETEASGSPWWFHVRLEHKDDFGDHTFCTSFTLSGNVAQSYPQSTYRCPACCADEISR